MALLERLETSEARWRAAEEKDRVQRIKQAQRQAVRDRIVQQTRALTPKPTPQPSLRDRATAVVGDVVEAATALPREVGRRTAAIAKSVVSDERKGPGAAQIAKAQGLVRKLPKDIQEQARNLNPSQQANLLRLINQGADERQLREAVGDARQEKSKEDKRLAGAVTEAASLTVGGGSLAQAAKGGAKTLAKTAATTAASGAAGAGGSRVQRDPDSSAKEIATEAAIGGGAGVVLSGAASGAGRVIRKLRSFDEAVAEGAGVTPQEIKKVRVAEEKAAKGPRVSAAKVDTPEIEEVVRRVDNPEVIAGIRSRVQGQAALQQQVPKEAGKLRRVFLSTSGQLSRLGEPGQELADRLARARDTAEISVGQWTERIPTVLKLNRREFTQFADSLDALSKGETPKLSPRLTQAIQEWNELAPQIRQRAVDTGIEVGDLGPNYFPKNYGDFLQSRKGLDAAAKHMVETGQAENISQAIQALRFARRKSRGVPYGHLEFERELNLPDYAKTKKALAEYLHFSAKRIGEAEQLGAKNEVGSELVDLVSEQGFDAARADQNLRIALGQVESGSTKEAVSRNIRKFNALRSLRTAAISNAGQSTNTATVAGYGNTIKAIGKFLTPEGRKFVRESGVASDAIINNITQQFGFDRGVISKVATPLFGRVEGFNRYVSSLAGAEWADSLAAKAAKGSQSAVRQLRKLGIEGDIGERLTPAQRIQAGRRLVERTQFKIDAQDLPAWVASPEGKLAAQFRTFSYKQSKFIADEILKPLSQGNPVPLARFMAALPVGYAVYKGKNFVRSRAEGSKDFSEDDEWIDAVKEAYESLGAGGLVSNVTFAAGQRGRPGFGGAIASAIGGPTAGFAAETIRGITEAGQGNTETLQRQALKSIPLVGNAVSNRVQPVGGETLADSLDEKTATALTTLSEETGYIPKPPSRKQRGKELNDSEYTTYMEVYKRFYANYLNKVVGTQAFKEASANTKKEVLQQVNQRAGNDARDQLFGEATVESDKDSTRVLDKAGL